MGTAAISNGVTYKGYARITFVNKNRKHTIKINNAGTSVLGDVISRALAGENIQSRVPSLLGFQMLINNGTTTTERNLLNRDVPFTGIVYGDSVNTADVTIPSNAQIIGAVQLTSVIQSGYTIPGMNVESRTLRITMLNSLKEPLAYIYDNNPAEENQLALLYEALSSGQDAIIDWVMYIMNLTTDTSTP